MIGVQVENRVQHPDLPILRNFALQLVKEIACLREIRSFRQRFFAMRNAPAVSNQGGNARDQSDRLADVGVMRVVA